jgi:hypothetical protein
VKLGTGAGAVIDVQFASMSADRARNLDHADGAGYFRSCLAMTMRWIWLVPS